MCRKSFMRIGAVVFSSILLCSFVVHAQDTHHTHGGQGEAHHSDISFTQTISEYAHGSEKKYIALPPASLLLVIVPDFFVGEFLVLADEVNIEFDYPIVFWEAQLFAQGILNTKLYQ